MKAGRRAIVFGSGLSIFVHGLFVLLFATASPKLPQSEVPEGRAVLCGEMRCPMLPMSARRRVPDAAQVETPILEAMVIPRLGLKKRAPKRLPRIQKYEQPEKVEKAVNISNKVKKPRRLKKAPKPKKAEKDRSRQKASSLADLLEAPEDPDPRAKATRLSRIVGHAKGSVHGTGRSFRAGNVYAAKVGLSIRRRFVAPQSISDDKLRSLSMEVLIREIAPDGSVVSYAVLRVSGNRLFDAAALAAIKRFVPAEGGSARLPPPDDTEAVNVRRRGMRVKLDGSEL